MFKNKVMLITGGTGSFGNAVLHRFLDSDVKEIRIFSRDEKKQEDMRIAYANDRIKFYIGDVRDYSSINAALKGVNFVFHAAALKQVPSCEFYPLEAVKTNVIGTENVLNAANANHVSRVVVLSTDKAVYPVNAMGISKAMAEKVMIAKSRTQNYNDPIFCATRYGNVMASRGSVIPLFVTQLKSGKQVSITDPQMTRFLMSLEDSVDLVMHAFKSANQGDIFVQKSPAASVRDLARSLIELFKPNGEIKIIGTRHGEKLYETLISREEMVRAKSEDQYFRISADTRDLNYEKYFSAGEETITQAQDYTSHNTIQLNVDQIKSLLIKLNYIQEMLND